MEFLLRLFRSVPQVAEIQDQQVIDKDYRYWRIRILYSMFIGYAFYYFTRKSFVIAMPGLIQELGFDKAQLGMLGTIFCITYGISKFTSGVMSDRFSPRYFMSFGLILTGIVNIFFGMSSSILLFALFWGFNGWFQGFGAPPCVRFLTQWYSVSERGSWWSTWSISHNVGSFVIAWLAGWCLLHLGWRYALYVPGVICIFGGLFLINRLRDTPQSMGLPSIEKFRNDYAGTSAKEESDGEKLTARQIFFEYILKNKYIWLLAIAYFFVYVVRTGISDWTALYLIETKGYSRLGANGCVSLFDVGGLCGMLFAGWSSDRLFKAKRGPVNGLFAMAIVAAVAFFWYVPEGYTMLDSVAMYLIGFSIFGPQMLIGVAAAELAHKKAAATSNGFVGLCAYLGAAVAGYPLGKIAQEFGWEGFFWALLTCGLVSVLVLLPLWNVTKKDEKVPAKVKALA